jgi:hypothetical protein
MRKNTNDSVQEAFRAGYFHRGAANPNIFSSTHWEAWEIGRHFHKNGLGFFTLRKSRGSSYLIENGKTASILYGKKGAFTVGMEDPLL